MVRQQGQQNFISILKVTRGTRSQCLLFKFYFCVDLKSYPTPLLLLPLTQEDQLLKRNTVRQPKFQIRILVLFF